MKNEIKNKYLIWTFNEIYFQILLEALIFRHIFLGFIEYYNNYKKYLKKYFIIFVETLCKSLLKIY